MSQSGRLGILLMVASMASFAVQDGFSRYLAEEYNTLMVVAFRYWVFAAYVIILALRRTAGFRAAVRSDRLGAHVLRSVLLVIEICIMVWAYTMIGLIETHAVFAACPLLVVLLSGPILGEKLSLRRILAVVVGMVGVVVILRPGSGVFSWPALLPLISALFFALYSVLTRLTARGEPNFPSFFWPAVIGAVLMTGLGLPSWQPVAAEDWPVMLGYAAVSVMSNWLLLKTYQLAEASAVQPFAYLQIVFISIIGITVFGETLAFAVVVGTVLVIAAGLYALWSERAVQNG